MEIVKNVGYLNHLLGNPLNLCDLKTALSLSFNLRISRLLIRNKNTQLKSGLKRHHINLVTH